MIKNFPAKSYLDVESMNEDYVVMGYFAGLRGLEEPENRDKWHGWRNGMVDSGRMGADEYQRAIAKHVIRNRIEPYFSLAIKLTEGEL